MYLMISIATYQPLLLVLLELQTLHMHCWCVCRPEILTGEHKYGSYISAVTPTSHREYQSLLLVLDTFKAARALAGAWTARPCKVHVRLPPAKQEMVFFGVSVREILNITHTRVNRKPGRARCLIRAENDSNHSRCHTLPCVRKLESSMGGCAAVTVCWKVTIRKFESWKTRS